MWRFVVGVAVGYVVGARAGRERYEQIRRAYDRVKQNPTVQRSVRRAADTARDGITTAAGAVRGS